MVSIIIPCYNTYNFIEDAISSANDQSILDKEIIVVDDGSNRKTKDVIKVNLSKITKLITQENKGVSNARNVGISSAKGEFILVWDSDDYFDKSFCEKAQYILQKNNDVKIVTCFTQRIKNEEKLDVIQPKSASIKDFLKYSCAMGSSMFRKQDWKNCNGYDEQMKGGFEDWEFYIRLLKNGGRTFVIPEILYYYRLHENSRTVKANSIKYELLRYIYMKHRELYVENYEILIEHFLSRMYTIENSEKNIQQKLDYKLGKLLLNPIRKIRNLGK